MLPQTLLSQNKEINDTLQRSVATYLRFGGVDNNGIKKGLLLNLSVKKIKIGECLAKLLARAWLFHALCAPGHHTAERRRKCTRQSRFCL